MTGEGEQGAETPASPMRKQATTGNEGFLMIGSALIVAGWLLFGVIIGEYAVSAVYVILATMVLLSTLAVAGLTVGAGTQRAIGLFMGIALFVTVLNDIRFSGFPDELVDWLAYLVFLAGAAIMFMGARGMKTS
jgi:hypothetical protein